MPCSCNACNAQFGDEAAQKVHYRSEWHQYNLRRKVAGVPGVSESLFRLKLEALEAEKKKLEEENLLYMCSVCDKVYRSRKAHAQHLRSRLHSNRASGVLASNSAEITVTRHAANKPGHMGRRLEEAQHDAVENGKLASDGKSELFLKDRKEGDEGISEDWEEVEEDHLSDEPTELESVEHVDSVDVEEEGVTSDLEDWVASQCFFCDLKPDGTIEGCVEHMHKVHGFFIPDSEYLKDPAGLLSYIGLKVTKDFTCLYCDDTGKRFHSLEAVRKHMISKSHCKLPYGDGHESAEEELEEFYDFGSSFVTEDGQIIAMEEDMVAPISLNASGSELVIMHDAQDREHVRIIGSRKFFRYYRQRPRPSDKRDGVLVNALVARYRNMGLETKHSESRVVRWTHRKHRGKPPEVCAEMMRTRVGIKNNVIKNLPKNVPF